MNKIAVFILVIMVIVLSCVCRCRATLTELKLVKEPSTFVIFQDAALETAVVSELGSPVPISTEDMLNLTHLFLLPGKDCIIIVRRKL